MRGSLYVNGPEGPQSLREFIEKLPKGGTLRFVIPQKPSAAGTEKMGQVGREVDSLPVEKTRSAMLPTFLKGGGFLLRSALRRPLRNAAALGLILLAVAANLHSPPGWLLLLGWTMLSIFLYAYIAELPQRNPYRVALYPMFFPLIGAASALEKPLFVVLEVPSATHLVRLLTSRPFLILVVIYLVCVCWLSTSTVGKKVLESVDKPTQSSGDIE
jgi:hypothetical protein